MRSATPTNSTCSMSELPDGTRRLSASPAKNAPTMPSRPIRSATSAAEVNAASRKRKRGVGASPKRANAHSPSKRSGNMQ